MSKAFSVTDLPQVIDALYPGIEGGREDTKPYLHPMTAVGIVLLTAALLETINQRKLVKLTTYTSRFISAIASNMANNALWVDGKYNHSSWLMPDGTIHNDRLWDHIEMACGTLFAPLGNTDSEIDTCGIYWDERGGFQ